MTQYPKSHIYTNTHNICTFSLVHLPGLSPHCSRSDESDSIVLAESMLDVSHTLLFYTFAKILVIPKLPMMELTVNGKSLPSSSYSPCLKDLYSALPCLTFKNLSVVCCCVNQWLTCTLCISDVPWRSTQQGR